MPPINSRRLAFPKVLHPEAPPVRPERHAANSIATMRRHLIVALATTLARCPCCNVRWTSYPLSRTGWLRPRHALASRDEGMELVSMKEGSGLRHRWCAVVWVKENLPLQQHARHPKQPVGDTA